MVLVLVLLRADIVVMRTLICRDGIRVMKQVSNGGQAGNVS